MSNRPKAGEVTAVKAALTIADTAAQEAILVPLFEHFPQVLLEAEEDTPTAARFPAQHSAHAGRVVMDPIDGTLRFYLEGRGPYAVMVGLAVEDVYQAALVALPREDLYLEAVRGAGARIGRGDGIPEPARASGDGNQVLVSHDLPEPAREALRRADLVPVPASGGAISVAPLLPGVRAGLRWMYQESASVSTRGRIGALIAEEAGARVCGADGEGFPSNIETPAQALLVAATDADLAVLQAAAAAAAAS